jgi:hypothetical protein
MPFGTELDRGALVAGVLRRNPNIDAARQGWKAAAARPAQVAGDPRRRGPKAPISSLSNDGSRLYVGVVSVEDARDNSLAAGKAGSRRAASSSASRCGSEACRAIDGDGFPGDTAARRDLALDRSRP